MFSSPSPDHLPEPSSNSHAERGRHSVHSSSDSDEALDNDARASLALFEGEPDADELASKNGDAHRNGDGASKGAIELADDTSMREFYAQLVSLLTHENTPPPPKPASRSSLRYALKRRFLPALLVTGLAFMGLSSLLRPRQVTYTAVTELLLPPRPAGTADEFAPPETSYDTSAQVALIGSEDITTDAVKHLPVKLRLKGWNVKEVFAAPVEVSANSSDGNGSLVGIAVPSLDPDASLALANEVVNAYQRSTRTRSTQNRDVNLKRINARVAQLNSALDKARSARADLKSRSGVGDASSAQSSSSTIIQGLQSELDTETRNAANATASDTTLSGLQERLRASRLALAAVLRDFLPDAPQAVAAQNEVNDTLRAIAGRRGEIQSATGNRLAGLRQSLARERAKASALPNIERQQNRLDDRITELEGTLHLATDRQSRLGLARDAIAPIAKILHSPYVGSSKGTQTARALFVAMLGALGLGLLSALVLDRLDRSVRATPDPEALWNAPVVGALPAQSDADAFFRATPSSGRGNPRAKTQNIEACYLAQSNILALAGQSGVRSILFSSALENEGKATTAANIAVAMAYGGRETLLVDADFWNPTQHKNFGLTLSPGYAQVLRDELPLSEAIRPTIVNNLYVLTPGQNASDGMGALTNRLGGAQHTKNMTLLKKYFDVIVIDGPPTISLGDAQLLAHLADAVVLVSAENTPRSEVQRARSMLRLSGAYLLGVVLSRVRRGEVADWNLQSAAEGASR